MIISDKYKIIETKTWKFNRRNINKIAYNYDAVVIRFDTQINIATLKDSRDRLLWVEDMRN